MVPVVALLMIIGGMGSVVTWIIGPTKGMLAASKDGELPAWLAKTNRFNAPVSILIIQGFIFTLLSWVYWFMPSVKSAYWVLTELTAQMSLLMYVIMFAAAIRLRYTQPAIERPYRIPGGNFVMWCIAGFGLITSFLVILLGYVTPLHVDVGEVWRYELVLIGGLLLFCTPPLFLHWYRHR